MYKENADHYIYNRRVYFYNTNRYYLGSNVDVKWRKIGDS